MLLVAATIMAPAAGAQSASTLDQAHSSLHRAWQQIRNNQLRQAEATLTGITKLQANLPDQSANDALIEIQADAYLSLGDIARQRSHTGSAIFSYEQALARQEEIFGTDNTRLVPLLAKLTALYEHPPANTQLARARQRLIELKSASTSADNPELFRAEVNRCQEHPQDAKLSAHIVDLIAAHPRYLAETTTMQKVYSLLTRSKDKANLLYALRGFSQRNVRLNNHALTRVMPTMVAVHYGLVRLGDHDTAVAMATRIKRGYTTIPVPISKKVDSICLLARQHADPSGLETVVVLTDLALELQNQSGRPLSLSEAAQLLDALSTAYPTASTRSPQSNQALALMKRVLPETFVGSEPSKLEFAIRYLQSTYPRLKEAGDTSSVPRFRRLFYELAQSNEPAQLADFILWAALADQIAVQLPDPVLGKLMLNKLEAILHSGDSAQKIVATLDDSSFFRTVWQQSTYWATRDDCRTATAYLVSVYDACNRNKALDTACNFKAKLLCAIVVSAAMALDRTNLERALVALDNLYRQHPELLNLTLTAYSQQIHFPPLPSHFKRMPQVEHLLSQSIAATRCSPAAVMEACFSLGCMGYYYADNETVVKLYARAANARALFPAKNLLPSLLSIQVPHLDILSYCHPADEVAKVARQLLSQGNGPDFPVESRKRIMSRYLSALYGLKKYDECLHNADLMEKLAANPEDNLRRLDAIMVKIRCYEERKDWSRVDALYAQAMSTRARVAKVDQGWLWNYSQETYDKYCQFKKRGYK